ncbi:MAG: dipeptide epimerase [Sandaracinaceae bacterium]|nr:dipeptide epimerase [Sandaracinaceae bacterium]
MTLRVEVERWPLREPFTIARGAKTEAVVVVAHLARDGLAGRGECVPYARYGETVEGVVEALRSGAPAEGAAASALELAHLELDARRAGVPVWAHLGLAAPRPVPILYTLPIRDPDETRRLAARAATWPVLKLKLGAPDDLARVRAAREGAPAARFVVDANEGWDRATLDRLVPALDALGVELIEQPLPAADDAALRGYDGPIPLCADESFRGAPAHLDALADRYHAVNVKLDKAGGLRPALACIARARALELRVMVGTMVATSLAVAPAVLAAQDADWADLDGPLYLATDRARALHVDAEHRMHPPDPALWG